MTARELARRVLERIERDKAWATPALDAELARAGLDDRDRRLASELVYGVLRHRSRIDRALAAHADLKKTPPRVVIALRVAAYQLMFLDRVPPYAIVDDAVAAARASGGQKLAGFANAVLRKIGAQKEPPFPPGRAGIEAEYSLPRWIANELAAAIAAEAEVASGSATKTASASVSGSASGSASAPVAGATSASASASASETASGSASASETVSGSATATATATGSATATASGTASGSATAKASASASASATATASTSGSATESTPVPLSRAARRAATEMSPAALDQLAARAAAFATSAPLVARANARRTTREAVRELLQTAGVTTHDVDIEPGTPQAFSIDNLGDPARSPSFTAGMWTVQDPGAQLVAHLARPRAGMKILDACAGVGGKSTHLAELADDKALIDAADRSATKLDLAAGTAQRLGITSLTRHVCDLTDPRAPLRTDYDLIVLDAPCSGLGVLRRHPDAKWRLVSEDVPRLAAVQRELLDAVVTRLAPTGSLIYSVCTFTRAEGPDQARAFAERTGLRLVEEHRTWPPDADAFYLARFER
ncbi:MAG: transcription antitermination factor NusB [Kofleriaceae bacterium]